jgi:PIN domain nuclease of toxin-antitoxin system
MTEPPLLDTHAWVWWVNGERRLGSRILEALNALPPEERPYLSDISLWEAATAVELGRLRLEMSLEAWLGAAAHPATVRVLPVTPEIAVEVARLPKTFHRDPADRLIVATSRVLGLPLLTRDKLIVRSRLVRRWSRH